MGAAALDEPRWPPPDGQAARMRELQAEISSRQATPEQREAARRELGRLLKSPGSAAPARSPARAAIQPFPSIPTTELKLPPLAEPGVARLEVVEPPRAMVNPATGTVVAPTGSTVFDLRTGRPLTQTPSGYIDPRTGQLIPK